MPQASLREVLRSRARHLVTENARVLATADCCGAVTWPASDPPVTASHQSLRDDFEVSWLEADAARRGGTPGRRSRRQMTGGKFGGSIIALVPAMAVSSSVTAAFSRAGWRARRRSTRCGRPAGPPA